MSKLVDDAIAFKILKMLTTPFNKTKAHKLGLIDENGNVLKNASTSEEKDAYSALDRLVFSVKRVIEKVPGGNTKLGSMTAAYLLVKESYQRDIYQSYTARYNAIKSLMESGVVFAKEEIQVKQFLEDVVANNTSGVEVKNPDAIPKKKKYKDIARRNNVAS